MKKKSNKTYIKLSDINTINKKLPINLTELQKTIDEVHRKYPLLDKSEISLICRSYLEEIREQLLKGNTINIRGLANNMKLFTFCKLINNKINFNTKIQVNTPGVLRKINVAK